ncbi:MAG: hypothetical protein AB199_02400 [Parcubacteria bacterium C7867-004]|nr:MAG: hypothetical protein AB199_02400 [Parcubacteria bacterium C7867-004]
MHGLVDLDFCLSEEANRLQRVLTGCAHERDKDTRPAPRNLKPEREMITRFRALITQGLLVQQANCDHVLTTLRMLTTLSFEPNGEGRVIEQLTSLFIFAQLSAKAPQLEKPPDA